jgi:hypothetical protein
VCQPVLLSCSNKSKTCLGTGGNHAPLDKTSFRQLHQKIPGFHGESISKPADNKVFGAQWRETCFGWSVEEGMCDACGRGSFQPLLYSKLGELLFHNGWWLITVGKLQKYVVESLQPRFSLAPMLSLRYALLAIPCDDNNNIVYG